MYKTALAIVTFGLIVSLGIIVLNGSSRVDTISVSQEQNVEVRDGIQYVTIRARGGYMPRVSSAASNIPTKLVIQTDGTYDCSLSLVIQSLKYQKILASTGEEVIDVGTPAPGQSLRGVCSMGMYSFVINFT